MLKCSEGRNYFVVQDSKQSFVCRVKLPVSVQDDDTTVGLHLIYICINTVLFFSFKVLFLPY